MGGIVRIITVLATGWFPCILKHYYSMGILHNAEVHVHVYCRLWILNGITKATTCISTVCDWTLKPKANSPQRYSWQWRRHSESPWWHHHSPRWWQRTTQESSEQTSTWSEQRRKCTRLQRLPPVEEGAHYADFVMNTMRIHVHVMWCRASKYRHSFHG